MSRAWIQGLWLAWLVGACVMRSPSRVDKESPITLDVGYAEINHAWSHTLQVDRVPGPFTWSLIDSPPGMSLDEETGELAFTPHRLGEHWVTVGLATVTQEPFEKRILISVLDHTQCVWSGVADADWSNPGNWSFCNGQAPIASNWIAIDDAAVPQPVLSSDAAVTGFDLSYYGAGTLVVASGVTLRLSSAVATVQSSVRLQGGTSTCDTCIVDATGLSVIENATLTLGEGIAMVVGVHATVQIGNGLTPGRFIAQSGSTDPLTWPRITCPPSHWHWMHINGAPGARSHVRIQGLHLDRVYDHAVSGPVLDFGGHYVLEQLDNLTIHVEPHNSGLVYGVGIRGCDTSEVVDFDWVNIQVDLSRAPAANVSVPCDPGGQIVITGQGPFNGEDYEDDPLDVVTWR